MPQIPGPRQNHSLFPGQSSYTETMASNPQAGAARESGTTHPGLGGVAPAVVPPRPGSIHTAELDASGRAAASMSALHHAIREADLGLAGALEENARLTEQLAQLRSELDQLRELERRVAELEGQLVTAAEERAFWMAEQDHFIASMLEEHEEELARTAATAVTAPPKTRAGEASAQRLAELEQERARSIELIRRLQRQRDDAQAEVMALRAELAGASPQPAAGANTRPTEPAKPVKPAAATLEAVSSGDRPTLDVQRATAPPPPAELARALTASRPSPPGGTDASGNTRRPAPQVPAALERLADPDPSAGQKKKPTATAVGGYSLSGDDSRVDAISVPAARHRRRP